MSLLTKKLGEGLKFKLIWLNPYAHWHPLLYSSDEMYHRYMAKWGTLCNVLPDQELGP